MIDNELMKAWLKEHLTVKIRTRFTTTGDDPTIVVSILLDNEVISQSDDVIPISDGAEVVLTLA